MNIHRSFMAIILVVACLPAWAQEHTVPFGVVRGRILVPVLLNNEKVSPFVLDLRVPNPVCDRVAAQQFGLITADTATNARTARAEMFQVGNAPVRDCQFVLMDLAPFAPPLGTPVMGVFSGREIADEIVLNFDQNTLAMHKGRNAQLESDQQPRTVRILQGPPETPTVSAILGGHRVQSLVLDTAFAGTLALPERLLREAGLIETDTRRLKVMQPKDARNTGPGTDQVRLSGVRIGPAEVQTPVCTILADDDTPRVGLGFLRHFVVTVNFAARLARFENLSSLPPYDPDVVGLGLVPGDYDGRLWSVWVVEGSSAAQAGIEPGERLVSVSDRPAEGLDYAAVSKLLETAEGKTVSVVLNRADGSTKTTPLKATALL